MTDNTFASVSGIVMRDGKVLLVRQSYGAAAGQLVIPGGYLAEGEMPCSALEREILEETGVTVSAISLFSIRFSKKDWWAIFEAEYISGEPVSDQNENSEALFLGLDDVLSRKDLTGTTKEILENYRAGSELTLSDFCPSGVEPINYQLFFSANNTIN